MTNAEKPKTYCFDLDGTLCSNTWGEYERARPFPWAIERVNALARAGSVILIFTARGGTTGIDWRPTTEAQLRDWGVKYDELIFGKPQADVYVDDRTVHVDAWRYGEAFSMPLGETAAAGAMPVLPPPRSSTVVEIGRTFGGEPFRLEQHARRALAVADAHGIPHVASEDEIGTAVAAAIEPSRTLLSAGDDIVFTIALSGAPHAGYVDTAEEGLEPSLTIGCRLLSQAASGLPRYLRDGAVAARSLGLGTTSAWPLDADRVGVLRDMLGGEVVVARGGELLVRTLRDHPPLALTETLRLGAEAGLSIREAMPPADQLAAGDELLIVDLPFCLLPVGVLDDRPLEPAPGPVARTIAAAWKELTCWDPQTCWRS